MYTSTALCGRSKPVEPPERNRISAPRSATPLPIREGDFSVGQRDDDYQVIPTAWIEAAQDCRTETEARLNGREVTAFCCGACVNLWHEAADRCDALIPQLSEVQRTSRGHSNSHVSAQIDGKARPLFHSC